MEPGKGFGLRSNEPLTKGSFITEYCGEVLSKELCDERVSGAYEKHKHFYLLQTSNGEIIDATVKGNLARFANHSCDPNCHIEEWYNTCMVSRM